MPDKKWTLQNLPPKGHRDVADFMHDLFDISNAEIERLKVHDNFINNYDLYRRKKDILVNLYFANIERTVSNICARPPVGEVVDLDGTGDNAEKILTADLLKWWKDTKQEPKGRKTVRGREIYGVSVEKPYYDREKDCPDILNQDVFGFFPAPGYWDEIATEAPYICYVSLDFVGKVEAEFGVKGVGAEDAYALLGGEREEQKQTLYGDQERPSHYAEPLTPMRNSGESTGDEKVERCLLFEMWVRDLSVRTVTEEMESVDEEGNAVIEKISKKESVYPDGVRKVTFVKAKNDSTVNSYMVLDDIVNPNINHELPVELAQTTHPWGRLPCFYRNSYEDLVTIWGFAASEQVGDLLEKIDYIIKKLVLYVVNVMTPPLIVQNHCGITRASIRSELEKSGRLILMPSVRNARIEFMPIPELPATFFNVLDRIVQFFDRVYQIEDADRGQAPRGVTAASAIVALQERNQMLMQEKSTSADSSAEEKSRWAIGLWQNFGITPHTVEVDGAPVSYRGISFAGRKFNFVVEAGSTMPKTSMQLAETAINLYSAGALSRRGLLEQTWPKWKEEVERGAEGSLSQALQILIEAGLPEDYAQQLGEYLMQPGQDPGDTQSNKEKQQQNTEATTMPQQPKPGVPRAQQGTQQGQEV